VSDVSEPLSTALMAASDDLRGQPVWRARVGVGSFIVLEIGGHRRSGSEDIGEYHLWVCGMDWELSLNGVVVATDIDDRDTMVTAVEGFAGRVVTRFDFDPKTLGFVLESDGGLHLRVFPSIYVSMNKWMLFMPDGMVWGAEDGRLFHRPESSNEASP
jgi:hypothetical protein